MAGNKHVRRPMEAQDSASGGPGGPENPLGFWLRATVKELQASEVVGPAGGS